MGPNLFKLKIFKIPLSDSNNKIIWLNITMKEMPGVDVFDALNHLVCEDENCLEGKLSAT
jgi:hypothetical protein